MFKMLLKFFDIFRSTNWTILPVTDSVTTIDGEVISNCYAERRWNGVEHEYKSLSKGAQLEAAALHAIR